MVMLARRCTMYFCYGSNMLTSRLRARCPGASFVATGSLVGHALAFHKRSVDGSGKCSIVEAGPATRVHGALAAIPERDERALHRAEFLGAGYALRCVQVNVGSDRVEARVFVAMDEFVDDALRPYAWYKAFVLHGALERGLPPAYVAAIESVAAIPDPDRMRATENERLLAPGASPAGGRRA